MSLVKNKQKIFLAVSPLVFLLIAGTSGWFFFEQKYAERIYPGVNVGGINFSGKTPEEVEAYWLQRNQPFLEKTFEFRAAEQIATVSAVDLDLGYDATLSATQAYLVGRSPYFFSNLVTKFFTQTRLEPYFRWQTQVLENTLVDLGRGIDLPVQNALFHFSKNRVTAFRPSRPGQRLNINRAQELFRESLTQISINQKIFINIDVPVDVIEPILTTDMANNFGIRKLIGQGFSEFKGSIPNRIHNIALAANKLNGLLIRPGETFSFNQAVGDISATTGYEAAYVIKEGRTVLGDGGGVCQVSTTLFRAALNAGLPIIERRAHAYRVSYYEQAGYKPGLDATVFAPGVDLKIKNDTPAFILIQTKVNDQNLNLTFELYGVSDDRQVKIYDHEVWNITPAPPPLYQDDPILPVGITKQVDFAAPGANASFKYKVTRNGEILQNETFVSNFRPWQAVYLRGTK